MKLVVLRLRFVCVASLSLVGRDRILLEGCLVVRQRNANANRLGYRADCPAGFRLQKDPDVKENIDR